MCLLQHIRQIDSYINKKKKNEKKRKKRERILTVYFITIKLRCYIALDSVEIDQKPKAELLYTK